MENNATNFKVILNKIVSELKNYYMKCEKDKGKLRQGTARIILPMTT